MADKCTQLRTVKAAKEGEPDRQYFAFTRAGVQRLGKRCQQSIEDLQREVGEPVKTKNGLSYSFKDNGADVLAVFHCDAVDRDSSHFFQHGRYCWSSRLDDRAGAWMLLDVLPEIGCQFDILATDGEERGQSTAQFFVPPHNRKYNWMVMFDRAGSDVVHYRYQESAWKTALNDSFTYSDVNHGSYSCICELGHLGACGVNVGVGYHGQHTLGSLLDLWETSYNLMRFVRFFSKHAKTHFPYAPPVVQQWRGGNNWDSGAKFVQSREWWDDDEVNYTVSRNFVPQPPAEPMKGNYVPASRVERTAPRNGQLWMP